MIGGSALLTSSFSYADSTDNNMQIKVSNDTENQVYALITANNQSCIKDSGAIEAGSTKDISLPKECWNAGRVYISEKPFENKGDQPIEGDYQLAEYTFTSDDSGVQTVHYDFSAVDSLDSLPIAIEPIDKNGNSRDGYVGMDSSLTKESIEDNIAKFNKETNWPIFKNDDPGYKGKIPGGYNLFAVPQIIGGDTGDKARQEIISKWYAWYNDNNNYKMCENAEDQSFCRAFESSVIDVINAFKQNAEYNNVSNPSEYQIIQHIIGYVPFGESWEYVTPEIGAKVIGLLRGIPTKDGDQSKLFPAYDSEYNLNPYVTFIHKVLGLHVYSFSIDDSIGNIQIPNYNGIQIDIGSTKSLPVDKLYNPNPQPGPGPGPGPTPAPSVAYNIFLGGGWGETTVSEVCVTDGHKQNGGVIRFTLRAINPAMLS